jgi:putative ABC transport system substrate-binding protein
MRRREFIVGLGSAAAWPVAARAQRTEQVRVGELWGGPRDAPLNRTLFPAFRDELSKLGWVEGRNLRVDYRFTDFDDRLRAAFAEELVNLRPNAIFAQSGPALLAVKQRTQVIPIVFVGGGDAVDNTYASSVARPTDNVTGYATYVTSLGGKWLELLREAVPGITRVGHIFSAESPSAQSNSPLVTVIDAAAPRLGIKIIRIPLRSPAEIEADISEFAAEPNGALLWTGVLSTAQQEAVRRAVLRNRLPEMRGGGAFDADNLMMVHRPDLSELVRGAASYVDRILRGAKPSDLPIQYPTKFTLTINLKAAKAVGLTIPASFLFRADEIIE